MASLEVAQTRRARRRGLLGRSSFEGALLLRPARSVHSFGMRFPLDVGFVDADGIVVDVVRLRRWRVTRPRMRAVGVIEAEHGAFERWGLAMGDHVGFSNDE